MSKKKQIKKLKKRLGYAWDEMVRQNQQLRSLEQQVKGLEFRTPYVGEKPIRPGSFLKDYPGKTVRIGVDQDSVDSLKFAIDRMRERRHGCWDLSEASEGGDRTDKTDEAVCMDADGEQEARTDGDGSTDGQTSDENADGLAIDPDQRIWVLHEIFYGPRRWRDLALHTLVGLNFIRLDRSSRRVYKVVSVDGLGVKLVAIGETAYYGKSAFFDHWMLLMSPVDGYEAGIKELEEWLLMGKKSPAKEDEAIQHVNVQELRKDADGEQEARTDGDGSTDGQTSYENPAEHCCLMDDLAILVVWREGEAAERVERCEIPLKTLVGLPCRKLNAVEATANVDAVTEFGVTLVYKDGNTEFFDESWFFDHWVLLLPPGLRRRPEEPDLAAGHVFSWGQVDAALARLGQGVAEMARRAGSSWGACQDLKLWLRARLGGLTEKGLRSAGVVAMKDALRAEFGDGPIRIPFMERVQGSVLADKVRSDSDGSNLTGSLAVTDSPSQESICDLDAPVPVVEVEARILPGEEFHVGIPIGQVACVDPEKVSLVDRKVELPSLGEPTRYIFNGDLVRRRLLEIEKGDSRLSGWAIRLGQLYIAKEGIPKKCTQSHCLEFVLRDGTGTVVENGLEVDL